ncbi:hypothetical protein DUNSADRAFT_10311 [Dunaliella salina]|uniref:Encoded protein n=1 Tax=Dunaliella salina TaxID=3046 RepID=A0ABQ7GFJ8_DUNSA|nr:hypothetical protein DUNSADRAFT_10311 [Dunaliella salina]|eukprot:KAF5833379.1 hypothetical protein DUNSADRAFT_10311 [Dunaliella salina]
MAPLAEANPSPTDHQTTHQAPIPPSPPPPPSSPAMGGSITHAPNAPAEPKTRTQHSANTSTTAAAAVPSEQAPASRDVQPADRAAEMQSEARDGKDSARQRNLAALIEAEGEAAAAPASGAMPPAFREGEKGLPLRRSSDNPAPAEASHLTQESKTGQTSAQSTGSVLFGLSAGSTDPELMHARRIDI